MLVVPAVLVNAILLVVLGAVLAVIVRVLLLARITVGVIALVDATAAQLSVEQESKIY